MWAINYGSTQCLNFRNWRRRNPVNPVVVLYLNIYVCVFVCMCACGTWPLFPQGWKGRGRLHVLTIQTWCPPWRIHKMTSSPLTVQGVINESGHCGGKQSPFMNPWWSVCLYFPSNPPRCKGVRSHTRSPSTQKEKKKQTESSHPCLKYYIKDLPSHQNHCRFLIWTANAPFKI